MINKLCFIVLCAVLNGTSSAYGKYLNKKFAGLKQHDCSTQN